jgi:hypothetical protein
MRYFFELELKIVDFISDVEGIDQILCKEKNMEQYTIESLYRKTLESGASRRFQSVRTHARSESSNICFLSFENDLRIGTKIPVVNHKCMATSSTPLF